MSKIKLGDQVRDKYTGLTGTAVSKTTYMNGCEQFEVQPKVDKDGKLPQEVGIDINNLELIKQEPEAEPEETPRGRGGPYRRYQR